MKEQHAELGGSWREEEEGGELLGGVGVRKVEAPHYVEAASGVASRQSTSIVPASAGTLWTSAGSPGCCSSESSVSSSLPFVVSSSRRVVSRSRSSCCRSLWSHASSSSWPTSATGACRPAARPPASTRLGSGGAARAPPKPVAPLSVERLVAGSPRREPGRSKPLSYQLRAPNSS